MKKVIAVSALAMAGLFSAQTLADESKTGFYVTGKAGASVMSLSDQRFVDGEGHGRINTKAVTKVIRFWRRPCGGIRFLSALQCAGAY